MFSEILKIKPQLDSGDLNTMVNSLSSRFSSVAKKFGSGLKSAILGGGITALAVSVIDRLLNPLKETQDIFENILNRVDDITTNAKQFQTSSGNLLKLETLAKAGGLNSDELGLMLQKFQVKLAQTRVDKKDKTPEEFKKETLANFVDIKDTGEAFFQFVQSLQKTKDKDKQVLAQQDVFGERLMLKQADFMNLDFAELLKKLNLGKTDQITNTLEGAGKVVDLNKALTAKRFFDDTIDKSSKINDGMVFAKDKSERRENKREAELLGSFESMKNVDDGIQALKRQVEKVLEYFEKSLVRGVDIGAKVDNVSTTIKNVVEGIKNPMEKVGNSRPIRGVLDFFGIEKVK